MWTCGIDIATQQLRPAMTSKVCSAAGDSPCGRGDHDARWEVEEVASVDGDCRRSASASGNMVDTQKRAMPGEPAHARLHREGLALDVAGREVLGVRVAGDADC